MLILLRDGKGRSLALPLMVGAAVLALAASSVQGAQAGSSKGQDMGLVLSSQQSMQVVLDPFSLRTVALRPAAAVRPAVPSQTLGMAVVGAGSTNTAGVKLRNSAIRIPIRPLLASPFQP